MYTVADIVAKFVRFGSEPIARVFSLCGSNQQADSNSNAESDCKFRYCAGCAVVLGSAHRSGRLVEAVRRGIINDSRAVSQVAQTVSDFVAHAGPHSLRPIKQKESGTDRHFCCPKKFFHIPHTDYPPGDV
jgi:hypothetical protein